MRQYDYAFPVECDQNSELEEQQGLTIREYFAAKAMSALALSGETPEDIAQESVRIADALIAELEKQR